jgi:hypothetical protein
MSLEENETLTLNKNDRFRKGPTIGKTNIMRQIDLNSISTAICSFDFKILTFHISLVFSKVFFVTLDLKDFLLIREENYLFSFDVPIVNSYFIINPNGK